MPKDKELKFMPLSEARQRLLTETGGSPGSNAYGTVMSWDEASEKWLPIMCGHGGSMWLCPGCAERLINNGWETTPT